MYLLRAALLATLAAAVPALASATIIDFEDSPALPAGPSTFAAAGPAQTIRLDGITLEGGVVLGLPTFLPATPFGTPPNLYGTARHPSGNAVGDLSLRSTLSISLLPSLSITTVEGILFNGLMASDSFVVQAFSAGTLVDQVMLLDLDSNVQRGFEIFRIDSKGPSIDRVTVSADLTGAFPGEFDFFIDTLAIGEPIENAVPEPASGCLLLFGLALLARRTRRPPAT